MSIAAALILAASVGTSAGIGTDTGTSTPTADAVAIAATAQVSARILRPAIVRQNSGQSGGLQNEGVDTPHHQITKRGELLLVEFQ